MSELLFKWDASLFYLINTGIGNSFFDVVLPWCREPLFWMPVYVFLLAFLGLNYGKTGLIAFVCILITVGAADFTGNQIKKQVRRLRPCRETRLEYPVVQRVACGSGYSFVSNHAANHFAAAVCVIGIIGRLDRRIKPILLGWATLIALAQVYVGVHFPSDIMAGAMLGALFGIAGSKIWRSFRRDF